jgi:hypothetical protein
LSITIHRTFVDEVDFDVEDAIGLASGLAITNPRMGTAKL